MRYCQDTIIYQDENIKKAEAVEMMLVESSNEIAEALANICPNRQDFIDNMNNTAKDLGLSMTFINPSGLDENNETESSAFGSPLDVAILINRLYLDYPTILESTSFSVFNGIKNTNNYASNWPFLLGSKTGYTDVAHGNLAILFEPIPNKRVSIVVLGSTKDGRFTDVQKLMNWYLKRL
jgi:D-alanyl-D-alanine carboxypeptidase